MTDITGDSRYAVAYALMLSVLRAERKADVNGRILLADDPDLVGTPATRADILNLFRECFVSAG